MAKRGEKIPGGLADGKSPAKYDQAQLKMGIKVEMEHTDDPAKAKEIAMDHLEEDARYYTHLAEMERKHGDAEKSMGGLSALDDYLEKAQKPNPNQMSLFGGGAPKKKAVVRIGKRGGKIVGTDSKGNPIYEGSAAAKKLQAKGKAKKTTTAQSGKGLTPENLVAFLQERPGATITAGELASSFGKTSSSVTKMLGKMVKEGKLEVQGRTLGRTAAYGLPGVEPMAPAKAKKPKNFTDLKPGETVSMNWMSHGSMLVTKRADGDYDARNEQGLRFGPYSTSEIRERAAGKVVPQDDYDARREQAKAAKVETQKAYDKAAIAADRASNAYLRAKDRGAHKAELADLARKASKAQGAAADAAQANGSRRDYGAHAKYEDRYHAWAVADQKEAQKASGAPVSQDEVMRQEAAYAERMSRLHKEVGRSWKAPDGRTMTVVRVKNDRAYVRMGKNSERMEIIPLSELDAREKQDTQNAGAGGQDSSDQVALHPGAMSSVQALLGRHYPDKGTQGLADDIGMEAFEALARVVNSNINREHPTRGDVRTALAAIKKNKETIRKRAPSNVGPIMHDEFGDLVKVLSSMSRNRKVRKSMDAIDQLDEFAKGGGPYIGPRGGKWADAQHTIPWGEDKAPKRAAGAAGAGKGKGGGDEGDTPPPVQRALEFSDKVSGSDSEDAHRLAVRKLRSVIWDVPAHLEADVNKRIDFHVAKYAPKVTLSPETKAAKAEWQRLADRGYTQGKGALHGKAAIERRDKKIRAAQEKFRKLLARDKAAAKKSMEDGMESALDTLGSFAETGDLEKAQKMPTGGPKKGLGEGEEQGLDLAGVGKPTGSVPPVSDNRQGVPKPKRDKLSEDDEEDEKQMTDHRKPIENPKEVEAAKSLEPLAHARVMTPSVIRDTVAKERAEKVSALRKGDEPVYVPTGAPRPPQAPQERPQGRVLRKGILVTDDSADREIEEMLKSDDFYSGGAPSLTAVVPLVQSKAACPQCGNTMAKSLTACPECGHGTVQHRFLPGGPAVQSPDAGTAEEGGNLHLRNPGLRRPKQQMVYIPDSE